MAVRTKLFEARIDVPCPQFVPMGLYHSVGNRELLIHISVGPAAKKLSQGREFWSITRPAFLSHPLPHLQR